MPSPAIKALSLLIFFNNGLKKTHELESGIQEIQLCLVKEILTKVKFKLKTSFS